MCNYMLQGKCDVNIELKWFISKNGALQLLRHVETHNKAFPDAVLQVPMMWRKVSMSVQQSCVLYKTYSFLSVQTSPCSRSFVELW